MKNCQTTNCAASFLIAGAAFALVVISGTLPACAQDTPQDAPSPAEILKDDKMRAAMSNKPNAEDGLALSRKLCVNCHLIGDTRDVTAPADVPTFLSIANRPRQSTELLTQWLMAPHAPMPDPHLTRIEIRDLAGYILSLRTAAP